MAETGAVVSVSWILIHVLDDDSLGVLRLDVFSRAAVSVSACTNLLPAHCQLGFLSGQPGY